MIKGSVLIVIFVAFVLLSDVRCQGDVNQNDTTTTTTDSTTTTTTTLSTTETTSTTTATSTSTPTETTSSTTMTTVTDTSVSTQTGQTSSSTTLPTISTQSGGQTTMVPTTSTQSPSCVDTNATFCAAFATPQFCSPSYTVNGMSLIFYCAKSCGVCAPVSCCLPNPCQNTGTCVIGSSNTCSCSCPPQFTGAHCTDWILSPSPTTTHSVTEAPVNPECTDFSPNFCKHFANLGYCSSSYSVNSAPMTVSCCQSCSSH